MTRHQLPDGTTPAVGDDVTSQVIATGEFTAPPSSTAFMYTLGGVQIPVALLWAVDAGYRFSRLAADSPVNPQGARSVSDTGFDLPVGPVMSRSV
jgi:opacity protein-like surface antigen